MALKTCPTCGRPNMDRVIYLALPGSLCRTKGCNTLLGLASYAPAITCTDERGERDYHFLRYNDFYLKALWQWLKSSWSLSRKALTEASPT